MDFVWLDLFGFCLFGGRGRLGVIFLFCFVFGVSCLCWGRVFVGFLECFFFGLFSLIVRSFLAVYQAPAPKDFLSWLFINSLLHWNQGSEDHTLCQIPSGRDVSLLFSISCRE